MEEMFNAIANMSDEEALKVLKTMFITWHSPRKNGKTFMSLTMQVAFSKAIQALEEKVNAQKGLPIDYNGD